MELTFENSAFVATISSTSLSCSDRWQEESPLEQSVAKQEVRKALLIKVLG
jgi:hypothetical protein